MGTLRSDLQENIIVNCFGPNAQLPCPHNGAPHTHPCLHAWESMKWPKLGHAASPGEWLKVGRFLRFALPAAN